MPTLRAFLMSIGRRHANDAEIQSSGRKRYQLFKDRSLGKVIETIMTKLKLEAACFGPTDGKRGGMLFVDLAEPSQIIEAVEPFFPNYNAEVHIVPR